MRSLKQKSGLCLALSAGIGLSILSIGLLSVPVGMMLSRTLTRSAGAAMMKRARASKLFGKNMEKQLGETGAS